MFFGRASETSSAKKLNPEKVYGIAPGPGDTKLEVEKKSVTNEASATKSLLKDWEHKANCIIASKYVCPSCGEIFDTENVVGGYVHMRGQDKTDANLKIVPICRFCNNKFRLRPFDVVEKFAVSAN